jgi:hypothetical protein
MSFISIGIVGNDFLIVAKYSIEPSNNKGCVNTDIPIAPESIIAFAIFVGSSLLLIFP